MMRVRHHLFLRERDAGVDGTDIRTQAEAAFRGYRVTVTRSGDFRAHTGGESLAEVATRVHLLPGELFRDRPRQRILVVSHAGTLSGVSLSAGDGAMTIHRAMGIGACPEMRRYELAFDPAAAGCSCAH